MSDTPNFMKRNPENNEKAAKGPLKSKKRGGSCSTPEPRLCAVFELTAEQSERVSPEFITNLNNQGYKEYKGSDGSIIYTKRY